MKFKGLGQISDSDVEAVEQRKREAAVEREEARLHRAESALASEPSSPGSKKKFVHAPRITAKKEKAKGDDESMEGRETEEEGEDETAGGAEGDAAPIAIVSDTGFVSGPSVASPPAAAAAAASPPESKQDIALKVAQQKAADAAVKAETAADVAAALADDEKKTDAAASKADAAGKQPCKVRAKATASMHAAVISVEALTAASSLPVLSCSTDQVAIAPTRSTSRSSRTRISSKHTKLGAILRHTSSALASRNSS